MKWVKISERLPVGCKHRMFWDAKNKIEVFRAYDQADPMLNKLPPHYTHWLEITGPDDYCEWKYDDYYGCYDRTCCEEPFYLSNDEPLPKNNIHHCPNCGRPVKEVKP